MRFHVQIAIWFLLAFCAVLLVHGQDKNEATPTRPEFVLRLGHASIVTAMSLSPDGHRLATASDDRTEEVDR